MEAALACARFSHFASTMLVFGASAFLQVFAPARLRAWIGRPLKPVLVAASFVALVSALVWLALEAASMGGDWALALDFDTIREVLVSTSFGSVWLWRLPWLAALVAVALVAPAERPGPTAAAGALALGSLALVDHASMQVGALGLLHRAGDAVHLLAAGGWLGGLPPFALCLQAAGQPKLAGEAGAAMLRFSAIGHFAVIVILLTGLLNIALTGGQWPWPPTSPYRVLLIAKFCVVAAMIALAVVNRYVLLPRIERSEAEARALSALAVVELALALTAVALVSYFGLLDPA